MRVFLFIIISLLPLLSMGQNHPSINSVFQFYYGAPESSLDSLNIELFDEKEYGNGHFYKIFWLDKVSGTYAVIRFPNFRSNYIYGAQVTGNSSDIPIIEGLRLGDSEDKVFEILGPPSDSNYVTDLNMTHYTFKNRNYSVEISTKGKLYSFAMHGDIGLLEKNGWSKNWQRYELSSLANETKKIQAFTAQVDSIDIQLVGSPTAFRPRVTFTGNTRTISKTNQEILEIFATGTNQKKLIDLYLTEIEVLEESTTYWLPIQKTLVEALFEETDNGKYPVDLFVTYIGHSSESTTFLVNEFILW